MSGGEKAARKLEDDFEDSLELQRLLGNGGKRALDAHWFQILIQKAIVRQGGAFYQAITALLE